MRKFLAYAPEDERSRNWVVHRAMMAGLKKHGIQAGERRIGIDPWEPADCIVMNGWRKPGRTHTEIIDRQIANGGRLLIMDSGYIRRKWYWSAGWDGINGRADFRNQGMPGDRWKALWRRPGIEPWRLDGSHVVVMGQVATDAAVAEIDFRTWANETIAELKSLTDRPILFRPHPKAKADPGIVGAEIVPGEISDALEGAWAAVTFNSTSAVDSMLYGIPVFAADEGSVAWPVANKSLARIEDPEMPDLTQWLADLAYAQWMPIEMTSGVAWDHLRSGF